MHEYRAKSGSWGQCGSPEGWNKVRKGDIGAMRANMDRGADHTELGGLCKDFGFSLGEIGN